MKIVAAVLIAFVLGSTGWAQTRPTQSRSVWLDDYSEEAGKAAVAAGKTTLLYYGGSTLALGNHSQVARYVAQRVAEELTNALVSSIVTPATAAAARPLNLADEATRVVTRAMTTFGFKNVLVMTDDSAQARALESTAKKLNLELAPKGAHVYFIDAHEIRPGQGISFNADYLRRWAARSVPEGRRKSVEDHAELLFVDRDHKWLRDDMIPAEDRAVVNPRLGRIFVETRITSILDQVRRVSPSHVR